MCDDYPSQLCSAHDDLGRKIGKDATLLAALCTAHAERAIFFQRACWWSTLRKLMSVGKPVRSRNTYLADEAHALADQLSQLASAAAAAVSAESSISSSSRAIAVGTEVDEHEVSHWEHAKSNLHHRTLEVEFQIRQLSAFKARLEEMEASLSLARALERKSLLEANREEALAADLCVKTAMVQETVAREAAQANADQVRRSLQEEAIAVKEQGQFCASEGESIAAVLEQELVDAEARERRAQEMAAALTASPRQHAEVRACYEALDAMHAAESQREVLVEDQASLKEELGNQRFALKDMKSFQHRRVQELDAQAQRLERQRKKLEAKYATKRRAEGASQVAGSTNLESQLVRLQQLNERLFTQVAEANADCTDHQNVAESLQVKLEELKCAELEESQAANIANGRLDCLMEEQGSMRRDAAQLQNRARLLGKQVTALEKTASHTSLQLEEAEAMVSRVLQEEESTEERSELLALRLQAAQSQLKPQTRARRGKDSAASSDSAPGGGDLRAKLCER